MKITASAVLRQDKVNAHNEARRSASELPQTEKQLTKLYSAYQLQIGMQKAKKSEKQRQMQVS